MVSSARSLSCGPLAPPSSAAKNCAKSSTTAQEQEGLEGLTVLCVSLLPHVASSQGFLEGEGEPVFQPFATAVRKAVGGGQSRLCHRKEVPQNAAAHRSAAAFVVHCVFSFRSSFFISPVVWQPGDHGVVERPVVKRRVCKVHGVSLSQRYPPGTESCKWQSLCFYFITAFPTR